MFCYCWRAWFLLYVLAEIGLTGLIFKNTKERKDMLAMIYRLWDNIHILIYAIVTPILNLVHKCRHDGREMAFLQTRNISTTHLSSSHSRDSMTACATKFSLAQPPFLRRRYHCRERWWEIVMLWQFRNWILCERGAFVSGCRWEEIIEEEKRL